MHSYIVTYEGWVNGKAIRKGQCAVDFPNQPSAEEFSKTVREIAASSSGCLETKHVIICGAFKL